MLLINKLFSGHIFRQKIFLTLCTQIEKMTTKRNYFVWMDLELTGLKVDIHKIVEAACILTDSHLNKLHEGLNVVIHQPPHVFDNECDPWPKEQHAKTGLIQESLNSKITLEEAENMLLQYIKKHTNYETNEGKYYLAGNSVYMDKMFLDKYMPSLSKIIHYQIIDVSTLKILCSHWYHDVPVKKKRLHRTFSDIEESIDELKYYREKLFVKI